MTRTTRTIDATPDQVWDVLADGWLFPLWVVGATRMRAVDDAWPEPGAKLHHSVGVWPLVLNDDTEVVDSVPGHRLDLRAKGWPIGEAAVSITLEPEGVQTRAVIVEDVVEGPGTLVPKPARGPMIAWRNVESLRRLAFLAEGRAAR
jgi:uncharacterized protein YndB with AHSA1/START domain